MGFKFERLEVWQLSLVLATEVHDMTRNWPQEEIYNLTKQVKRAADSVALNIAEGSTGNTNPEFRRFCGIANRSALEVVCCLHLAKNRNLIDLAEFKEMYIKLTRITKMLQSLRRSLK